MKERKLLGYFGIYLRGLAMGAADVVPGVSGGTIAFISGIYEELLDTIKGVNLGTLQSLKKDGIVATWKKINGAFILSLFAGIFTSIITLASAISGILEQKGQTGEKIALWSFFFGLIIASIIYIGKQVKNWSIEDITGLIVSTAVAYYITIAGISEDSGSLGFLFFAGMIAISAMILPGISGSFILVLLGAYQPIMGGLKGTISALKDGDYTLMVSEGIPIVVVAIGCLVGLLTFSRVLSWLFKSHENITLATLTGFMIGSLNKIWPWKEVVRYRINSEGLKVPVVTSNLFPSDFEIMYSMDSFLIYSIIFAAIGFALVFGLEFIGKKMGNEQ
jgi:putative membrane protein